MVFFDSIVERMYENPEGIAVGLAIVVFAVTYQVLKMIFRKTARGVPILLSIIISILAAYNFYKNDFYGYIDAMALLFLAIAILIFLKVAWTFLKSMGVSTGVSGN